MGAPKLDWSFADAPEDSGAAEPGSSPARGPAKSPRRHLSRPLIFGLLGVAAVIGLGVWLFTRVGLLRIQSQLLAQIAYEDQRARAGDVAAVLALQAPDNATWRDQVAAHVRLGLAASLPAGDLLPAGTPPRLTRVDPLGSDLFSAVVTRDYGDSAGHTYSFDLAQRYRNLAPGQWERLPPETTTLITTTVFQGQRLSITVPTADLPWLRPVLLQADDLLIQTCADWGDVCQSGQRLTATFDPMPEFTDPTVVVRPASAAGSGYPRVFDLASATSRFPDGHSGYDLVTPLLAGRPHDSAAQAALSRSVSVRLLSLFAGEVASGGRAENDYFLDALVARAEVRYLGGENGPQILAPKDYAPLNFLRQMASSSRFDSSWRTDLAWRREAFDFINFALAGQPPSTDGKLLRSIRVQDSPSLDDWLVGALGPAARDLADAWSRQAVANFANHPVADWSRYDGLLMACDEGVFQVQGGAARRALPDLYQGTDRNMYLGEISPDGRYTVFNYHAPGPANPNGTQQTWTEVDVMDLISRVQSPVAAATFAYVVGWTAGDSLVYWSSPDDIVSPVLNSQYRHTDAGDIVQLRTYQPATGAHDILIPNPVFADLMSRAAWSADHSALLLALAKELPGGHFQPSLAVLAFSPSVQLRPMTQYGDGAALSPDGSRVAYITGPLTQSLNQINLLDLATGSVASLAAASYLGPPLDSASFGDLRWSADGRQIAWLAYSNPGIYLFIAPAAGGQPRMWSDRVPRELSIGGFSPDGRYLAVSARDLQGPIGQFWLLDPQSASVQPTVTGSAYSTIWAPTGHRLVIAGPAGVSAFDPATGAYEWLGPWQNCQLRW